MRTFSVCNEKNQNVLPERLFQRERQSWERCAQLGTLVGLLLVTTGLAASAMLELTSSASSGRFGVCRWPNCNLHQLGTHALVPRVRFWGDQGRKPNSAASSAWGSLKKKLRHPWLACSDDGCHVFGSQKHSLAAAQNWPILHQTDLEKLGSLSAFLLEKVKSSAYRSSCRASVGGSSTNS